MHSLVVFYVLFSFFSNNNINVHNYLCIYLYLCNLNKLIKIVIVTVISY